MSEDASADYEVTGAVEFEQEDLAGCERLELTRTARLPEVHLFETGLASKKLEPIDRDNLPDYAYYDEIATRLDDLLANDIANLPNGSRKLKFPIKDGKLIIQSDDPRLAGILSAILPA